ncbi:clathrin light chain B isoform X2 [Palaemon carinicauda]|uniref:clathrin light chain B isoform X2 n=1 Tax=Palaemon carinicauda TaxID=392227 RepID=UPI0035B59770
MDGFGDSFVPTAEPAAPAGEVDPAAEFLAREQDQLAGIDDDLIPAAPASEEPETAAAPPPAVVPEAGEQPAESEDMHGGVSSPGLDGAADFFGGAPPMNGGPDLESFEMLGGDEVARDQATAPSQPSGDDPWAAGQSSEAPQETFSQPPVDGGLGFMEPLSSQTDPIGEGEGFLPTSDLTGAAADAAATAPERDYSAFSNDFGEPTLPAGDASASAGVFSGVGESDLPESSSYPEPARSPVPTIQREEPEKIKIWREEQRIRLEQKDIEEEENKNELREKAKKELEEWYKQHEEQVAKTRQANRSAEKELVADTAKMEPGTEWERIAKLCDFNPKTAKSSRDISRMRSIILQVKQNPPVKA